MSELRNKTVRGALWTLLQNLFGRFFSFIVFAILANLLVPDDFGAVALATIVVALITILIDGGLSAAITQWDQLEDEHLDSAFWLNLGVALLLGGSMVATAGLIGVAFASPILSELLPWLAVALVMRALSVVQAGLLKRRFQFKALAFRSMAGQAVGGVSAIAAALYGLGVWSLVIQQIVSSTVSTTVLWLSSTWRPSLRVSLPHLRQLVGFGVHLIGSSLLHFANRQGDKSLIGYFLGQTSLGIYAVGYRVLEVVTQLVTGPAKGVSLSLFSRLQNDPVATVNALIKATTFTSLFAFPAFVGLALLAPELVVVGFGEKWSESADVLRILCGIGLIHSLNYYFSSIYVGVGRPDLRFKLLVVNTIANLIGFAIGLRWGIVGVASAYVIRGYVFLPLNLLVLRSLISLRLRRWLACLVPAVCGCVAMSAVVICLKRFQVLDGLLPTASLAALIMAGGAMYAVAMLVIARPILASAWSTLQSATRRN